MNKFRIDENSDDLNLSEKEKDELRIKIVESKYHLNAQFFVEVLKASVELQGKLIINRYQTRSYNIEICQDVDYCGFNVKGFDLDLLDCFKGISVDDHNNYKDGIHTGDEAVPDSPILSLASAVTAIKAAVDQDFFFNNNNRQFTMTTRAVDRKGLQLSQYRLDGLDEINDDAAESGGVGIASAGVDKLPEMKEDKELESDTKTAAPVQEHKVSTKTLRVSTKGGAHGNFDSTKSIRFAAYHSASGGSLVPTPQKSLRALKSLSDNGDIMGDGDNMDNPNLMAIEMVIYPYGFKDRSRNLDLTINSMIIHFSDVLIENKEYDNQLINFDWKCHIKNPRKEVNGIKDTIEGFITTWGKNVQEKEQVIKLAKHYYHVTRSAKMCGKFAKHPKKFGVNDLEPLIDPLLIEATVKVYDEWLTVENFSNKELFETRGKTFCDWFASVFVSIIGKKPAEQIEYRMKGLEILKFHDRFVPIVKNNINDAKTNLENAIEAKMGQDDEKSQKLKMTFVDELKKYGYF